MRKIYNLRLVNTGDLYSTYSSVRLQGETENGRKIVLNRVTYFNRNNGLLYTTKCGYIVMNFAEQSEYEVNEFIQGQLNEVWETV